MMGIESVLAAPLQSGIIPRGSRVEVFQQIYWVFLILGTVVGVVVIGYMIQKAYRYRDQGGEGADDIDRPEVGELPSGSGGGKKLLLSFSLSAIIVISLIVWTYGTLLYVETAPAQQPNELTIQVEGYRFAWDFIYPNGHTTTNTLRVPEDRMVQLRLTSRDVWHNFGVPELRVKADAIPGQTTETWFQAQETGTYAAHCYELCGSGHSYMDAEVIVMEPNEYQQWYQNTTAS